MFVFFTPLGGTALPGERHPIPDGDRQGFGRIVRTGPGSQPWP